MLLGMATGQAEAVREDVGGLLLYTPVVHPREFDVAIAYLVRRLEEGASDDNFMSSVFDLASSERLFARERDRFAASLAALDTVVPPAHRVPRGASSGRPRRPVPERGRHRSRRPGPPRLGERDPAAGGTVGGGRRARSRHTP